MTQREKEMGIDACLVLEEIGYGEYARELLCKLNSVEVVCEA